MISPILIILSISCTIKTRSSSEQSPKPAAAGPAPPPYCDPKSTSNIKDDQKLMIHRLRYIGNLPEKEIGIKEKEDACVKEAKILFQELYGEDKATKAEMRNFMNRPILVQATADPQQPPQEGGSKPYRWIEISGNNLIYWLSEDPGWAGFQPNWYWKAYAKLAQDLLDLELQKRDNTIIRYSDATPEKFEFIGGPPKSEESLKHDWSKAPIANRKRASSQILTGSRDSVPKLQRARSQTMMRSDGSSVNKGLSNLGNSIKPLRKGETRLQTYPELQEAEEARSEIPVTPKTQQTGPGIREFAATQSRQKSSDSLSSQQSSGTSKESAETSSESESTNSGEERTPFEGGSSSESAASSSAEEAAGAETDDELPVSDDGFGAAQQGQAEQGQAEQEQVKQYDAEPPRPKKKKKVQYEYSATGLIRKAKDNSKRIGGGYDTWHEEWNPRQRKWERASKQREKEILAAAQKEHKANLRSIQQGERPFPQLPGGVKRRKL